MIINKRKYTGSDLGLRLINISWGVFGTVLIPDAFSCFSSHEPKGFPYYPSQILCVSELRGSATKRITYKHSLNINHWVFPSEGRLCFQ